MSGSEKTWSWYAGRSEDNFEEGPFATRQEAIDAGFDQLCDDDEAGFYIIEATKSGVRTDIFDGDHVSDIIEDRNEGARQDGESLMDEVTTQELNELVAELNKVVKAWADKHDIHKHVWTFKGTRGLSFVHRNHNPGAEA